MTRDNGDDHEEEEERPQKKQAKHDSGAADLEKVTDYVEESEINSQNVAEVCTSSQIMWSFLSTFYLYFYIHFYIYF